MAFMDVILISVVSIIIYVIITTLNNKRRRGPRGYPFIGNSLDVDSINLHVKFDEWAREYGEIFRVNLFGRNIIVLNSADVIREALLYEPNATILSGRVLGSVGQDYFYKFHDIAFSTYTKETVKRRKLGYRLMKAYGEGIANIERCIHEELEITIRKINQNTDKVIEPENIIDNFLCGVLITLFVGSRHEPDSDLVTIMKEFNHLLTLMMSPGLDFLLTWFPVIKYIPCQISTNYHKTKQAQHKFFELLIAEMNKNTDSKGIVNELFKAQQSDLDDQGQRWITEDDIFGIISNLLAATFLSSKGTLLSLMYCILTCPSVQRNIQKEVDEVVGTDRLPKIHDRKQMPYTEAVILETLRLANTSPAPIPHCAIQNTKLRGIEIPKGTAVILNLWTTHFNEAIWESPYKFKPERFLDDSGKLLQYNSIPIQKLQKEICGSHNSLDYKRKSVDRKFQLKGETGTYWFCMFPPCRNGFRAFKKQRMLAFGVGKRSCIGEVFAMNRIFLFVSTMMQNFTLHPVDGVKLSPFDPWKMRPGIVRIPHSFTCKIEEREKQ